MAEAKAEARKLAEILTRALDWFGEGLDTRDLKNARALLDLLLSEASPNSWRRGWAARLGLATVQRICKERLPSLPA